MAGPLYLLFSLLVTSASPSATADEPRYACQPPHHNHHLFCNTTLPIPTRARSLVSLLTLQEKILLLSNTAPAVPRLGIPPYEWWSESLHGVAANGPGVSFTSGGPVHSATGFPQVILAAASFNRTLWFEVARAVAVEARAMYNVGQAGLTFWAPNVNVFRDPRWGRGQETPGEDPVVTEEYAVAYVRGFQGMAEDGEEGRRRVLEQKGERLMVSACCKHYTAYDLEKWGNFTRYAFNAKVTEQDMEDTYQPPFHSCIRDGHASCLMCSYNEVNGVPMCADHSLLQKARDEWGFQGYITSDCNAVATIFEYQNYTSSPIDAVALALKAGVDINCGGYYTLYAKPALECGKIVEDDIDRALHNLFTVQLRLGFFDGDPANQQYGKLGSGDICTTKHKKLALEAVRQGIVLLKNDRDLLPLSRNHLLLSGNDPEVMSLAVIGPIADNSSKLNGDYSGVPCEEKSLIDAFKVRIPNVSFVAGCTDGVQCESTRGFQEAMQIAGEAEQVVLVVGLDLEQEGEDLDRVSLLLPDNQAELVRAVSSVSRNPVVLVLVSGGPLDVSFAQEDPKVGSIIWVGYPGEAGAQATIEVIFGDFNPGGRLPITWYPEAFTSVPMDDMHMRPDPSRGYPGRTYRFYTGTVLYEFGHGLSYTTYSHAFVSAPERISFTSSAAHIHRESAELLKRDGLDYVVVDDVREYCGALKFVVQISVRNEGRVSGSHAVLLFSRYETRVRGAPKKQLVGFDRVRVPSGEAANATILVKPCAHLSTADEKGNRILRFGGYVLMLDPGTEHSLVIEA